MNLKEIYKIILEQLKDIFTVENPDLRLEQAEFKKDEGIWEVVVSYLVDNVNRPINQKGDWASDYNYRSYNYHRLYKLMKLDKDKNIIGFYIYEKDN